MVPIYLHTIARDGVMQKPYLGKSSTGCWVWIENQPRQQRILAIKTNREMTNGYGHIIRTVGEQTPEAF